MQKYYLQFSLVFPGKQVNFETEQITIAIPASNKEEAKEKLQAFVKAKMSIPVTYIDTVPPSEPPPPTSSTTSFPFGKMDQMEDLVKQAKQFFGKDAKVGFE